MKKLNLNQAIFVGIDVHSLEHTAVAANRFEERLGKLRFSNTKEEIRKFLSWLKKIAPEKKPVIIGIEGSGGNGRVLSSMVVKEYQQVYEVNPLFTKQRREYGTKQDKSDEKDAQLIIEVLTKKLDQLPRISQQDNSASLLSLRELFRFYEELVSQRTRLKNQIYPLLRQQGVLEDRVLFSQKQIKRWQARLSQPKASLEEKTLRLITKQKLSQIKKLNSTIDKIKEELKEFVSQSQHYHLTTMKGINAILAAKIISEAKGIKRFGNLNKFIKYAGIAPREQSSGKTKRHRKSKRGNRRLNSAFYLLALNQLRWNPKAKEYFQKKISEGKTKKHALRCLSKRVACIVYGMLRNGKPYKRD